MAYSDEYRSAQDVLRGEGGDGTNLNEVARAAAETDGVTASEYIGYAEAFAEYEKRPDVEPLSERRAREAAVAATEQDFRREGRGSGAVFTSPKDGNVGGLTDAAGGPIDLPGSGAGDSLDTDGDGQPDDGTPVDGGA